MAEAFAHLKTSAGAWLDISEDDTVWYRGARLAEMGVEPAARRSGKRRDRIHLSRQIQRQDVFRAAGAPSSKCLLLYPDGIPPDGKSGGVGQI